MKLDRLIFVNWGHIASGTYEMGNLTLLTGPTGAGKSTMLDGLQVVLTGTHRNVMNLNPGQDETGAGGAPREKTRRSVEAYVVGAEKNLFARPNGAQGYVAAVFQPDPGEDQCKPFTAIVGAAARVEGNGETRYAKLEGLQLFIVDGAIVGEEVFLPDPDSGAVVHVDAVGRALKQRYPKVAEFGDRKVDYLSALFGRFRGRTSVVKDEALQAARAWVQSIAYRKIGAVHELVRDEILDLDQKELLAGIENISGLMKDVAKLRQEGERLRENASRLDKVVSLLRQTATAHEEHVVHEAFAANLKLEQDKAEERRQRQRVEDCEGNRARWRNLIEERKGRRHLLDEDRGNLRARMSGVSAQQQKTTLEGRINAATNASRGILNELSSGLRAAGVMDTRAQAALALKAPTGMDRVNAALKRVADAYCATNLTPLLKAGPMVNEQLLAKEFSVDVLREVAVALCDEQAVGLQGLYAALVGAEDSLQSAVTQQAALHEKTVQDAERRVDDLQARKAALARGEVEYPPAVKYALRTLKEVFPDAMPQVLCDLVEPKNPKWQPAIEGYIRGARFNLLVKPDWEKDVINYVRSKNWREVKVIQGRLCLKDLQTQGQPPANSIVHELIAPNDIAWAYLASQYGSVLKVETVEELQHTKRGLMRDGKASGSRAYFLADAKELVFGAEARLRQLASVTSELEEAERTFATAKEQAQTLSQTRSMLAGLKTVEFNAGELWQHAEELEAARQALAALDLTELAEMQSALDKLNADIAEIDGQNEADLVHIAEAGKDIQSANRVIADVMGRRDSLLEAVQVQTRRLGALAEANPEQNYTQLSVRVDGMLQHAGTTAQAARERATALDTQSRNLLGDAVLALGEYHKDCRADEQFVDCVSYVQAGVAFDPEYRRVVSLATDAAARLAVMRSTGLYNNELELQKATRSFNDVFTKHFCVDIKTRVDEGIRTLRQITNELRNLSFGQDSYSIDWSQWEPELKDYLDFFEAVTELTGFNESVDLFAPDQLSQRHVEIRDRLVKLLTSNDQERAQKDLLRIADYRNYRRYDIICESPNGGRVKLSTWGTGSGGQMETPAYIVRAAVVTNRLKMFEKGPSLRLLVNDEAFSKMDETRARAVLCFMRDKLNMQVVSAMPTMKAGPLKDEFNREYNFTQLKPATNGELDFCVDVKELQFKQDKMRELWARHRENVREKARLEFDAQYPLPEPIPPAAEVLVK
jgi:energy-coupling factor transporter ATP-binding protein EcfA2